MASLIAAYTVAWSVLMVYVLTLAARQRRLRRGLEQLDARLRPEAASHPQSHAH